MMFFIYIFEPSFFCVNILPHPITTQICLHDGGRNHFDFTLTSSVFSSAAESAVNSA
jgi:hypothetical protein